MSLLNVPNIRKLGPIYVLCTVPIKSTVWKICRTGKIHKMLLDGTILVAGLVDEPIYTIRWKI